MKMYKCPKCGRTSETANTITGMTCLCGTPMIDVTSNEDIAKSSIINVDGEKYECSTCKSPEVFSVTCTCGNTMERVGDEKTIKEKELKFITQFPTHTFSEEEINNANLLCKALGVENKDLLDIKVCIAFDEPITVVFTKGVTKKQWNELSKLFK